MRDRSETPLAAAVDAAVRLSYRLAFRLLRAWWFLRRPRHAGAIVAVWAEGRVLLVRQSYRETLTFPGGGVGRGETPRAAARRELGEEVGLVADEAALAFVGDWAGWWDYRRERVAIFELRLSAMPALRLDNREIVDAALLTPEEALARPLPSFVRHYLEDGLRKAATGVP
jgi:8-oxo-dGTP diphosphatase